MDSVVKLEPKVISLMAGVNDLAAGRAPDEIGATYRILIDKLREQLPDTKMIVSSVLPVTSEHSIQPEDILALNRCLDALCKEKGIFYLDMFSDFADENNHLKSDYALDTVHLTSQGYALWLSYLVQPLADRK